MDSKANLHIAFKIGMIVLGVVHLLLALTVFVQIVREAIADKELAKQYESVFFWRKLDLEEATIAPAFLMTIVTGVVILIFVCIQKYFLIFVVIGTSVFELILFIVCAVRSHKAKDKLTKEIDYGRNYRGIWTAHPGWKKLLKMVDDYNSIVDGNLGVSYTGLIVIVGTWAFCGFVAFKYYPRRGPGGNEEKIEENSTSEIQDV